MLPSCGHCDIVPTNLLDSLVLARGSCRKSTAFVILCLEDADALPAIYWILASSRFGRQCSTQPSAGLLASAAIPS